MEFRHTIYRNIQNVRPVDLVYKPVAVTDFFDKSDDKIQSRLQHRSILVPDIDLKRFETKAVIDWIELAVVLLTPAHVKDINRITYRIMNRNQRVEPGEKLPGELLQNFAIRFQEPDFRLVNEVLEEIDQKWVINSAPRLKGIEISVDFYSKASDPEELARLHGYMTRQLFVEKERREQKNQWPRFVFDRGDGKPKARYTLPNGFAYSLSGHRKNRSPDLLFSGCYGGTYCIDKRKDPDWMWRLMVKEIDQQNKNAGTSVSLPVSKHRVRLEVTLGPAALHRLKLNSLCSLKSWNLTGAQAKELFVFRLPTVSEHSETEVSGIAAVLNRINAERVEAFLRSGVLGLEAFDSASTFIRKQNRTDLTKHVRMKGESIQPEIRRGKGKNGTLVNWDAMTRKIEQALRHLDARVKKQMEN